MRGQSIFTMTAAMVMLVACGTSSKNKDHQSGSSKIEYPQASSPAIAETHEEAEALPRVQEEMLSDSDAHAMVIAEASETEVEVEKNSSVNEEPTGPKAGSEFLIILSKAMLEHNFSDAISEPYNESRFSNGAQITTKGQLNGTTRLELVKSTHMIALDTIFVANSQGTLHGTSNHPKAYTTFSANTNVSTNSRTGFRMGKTGNIGYQKTRTNYTPQVSITGVRVNPRGVFRRVIVNQARDRVYSSRGQMASQLGSSTATTINQKMDQEASSAILQGKLNQLTDIRDLLSSTESAKSRLNVSTESNYISYKLNTNRELYGAPGARGDVIVRFHQDSLNEILTANTSGKTLTAKELQAQLGAVFDTLAGPENTEQGEFDDVTFVMQDQDPIKVTAENNKLTILLRTKKITAGEDGEYDYEFDITVSYNVVDEDGKLALVRDGDITIYPPGFKPGVDLLKRKQKIVIDELKLEFAKFYKDELISNVPTNHPSGKKLVLNGLHANNGWFMLSHLLR